MPNSFCKQYLDDHLIFGNKGSFIPGSVERVVTEDTPESQYRNPFLAAAMVNVKMVETAGGGIRKMHNYQRIRAFPMPDYDFSDGVKVTITGKVLDMDYAAVLARDKELTLEEIIMLDKVQKRKRLHETEEKHLRRRGLIEGKRPNYYFSLKVAQNTNQPKLPVTRVKKESGFRAFRFELPHLNPFAFLRMLSEAKVIALYCITDDLLTALGHTEDRRVRVSDAEVITTAFVSALYFSGHQERARLFMKMTGHIPHMLDKSRFNRRLHRLCEVLGHLFSVLGRQLKNMAGAANYVLDSFPVPACDNIRISRCRILKGKGWRGYQASMRRYFYGVKVQVLTLGGVPVEFCLVPGSEADVRALQQLPLAVAPESSIYADAAYTDYRTEDMLFATEGVHMATQRKKNSKRTDPPYRDFLKEHFRKGIETTFSLVKANMPRHIHAVTDKGFFLKTALFVIAFSFDKITD